MRNSLNCRFKHPLSYMMSIAFHHPHLFQHGPWLLLKTNDTSLISIAFNIIIHGFLVNKSINNQRQAIRYKFKSVDPTMLKNPLGA